MKTATRRILVAMTMSAVLVGCGSGSSSPRRTRNANLPTAPAITFTSATSSEGRDTFVDAKNNTYMVGSISGTQDFDPGPGATTVTAKGGYVAKYDYTGNLAWVKTISSTSMIYPNRVASDSGGNLYIEGFFTGTADFDPDSGVQSRTSTSTREADTFVLKLDAQGSFVWIGTLTGVFSNALAVTASGDVFIGGGFTKSVDLDPSDGVKTVDPVTGGSGFVDKIGPNGNLVWTRTWGPDVASIVESLSINADGRILIGTSGSVTQPFVGKTAGVALLDDAGNTMWKHILTTTATTAPWVTSVFLDSTGSAFVAGDFNKLVVLDAKGFTEPTAGEHFVTSSAQGAFLLKLNADGSFGYMDALMSTCITAACAFAESMDVTVDTSGNAYLVGSARGPLKFGTEESVVLSPVRTSAYITKFDATGEPIWTRYLVGAGTLSDQSYAESAYINAAGVLSMIGGFSGTVNFDTNGGTNTATTPTATSGTYSWAVTEAYDLVLDQSGNSVRPTSDGTVVTSTTAATTVASTVPVPVVTAGPVVTVAPTSVFLKVGGRVSAAQVASYLKVSVAKGAAVSITVSTKSKTVCSVSRGWLTGRKVGQCQLTVKVTPKKGKATSKAGTVPVS